MSGKKTWGRDGGVWDIAVGSKKMEPEMKILSFSITEFGDKWKARDLLFEMKDLGEVVEVVIPPKQDRKGRRYGFVRFANVVEEKLLAIKLHSLILDGRKMFANLPRFQRSNVSESSDSNRRVYHGGKHFYKEQGNKWMGRVDGRYFADVLGNRKNNHKAGDSYLKSTLVVEAVEEDIIRCQRAYTGFLKSPIEESELKGIFLEEGLFYIRVTMLGPNMCILEDLVLGEVEAFLVERKEWWKSLFSRIRPWELEDVAMERLT